MSILRIISNARQRILLEGIAAQPRQQGWHWALSVVLILGLLCGCTAFRGGPERLSDVHKDTKLLKKYFEKELLDKYDSIDIAVNPTAKRLMRNDIVNGRLQAIDLLYNDFKQKLYAEGVGGNIGFDLTTISLGVAGALASEGTSQTLSGISAGVTGFKGSIDKNLFYEKTMPALLAEMDALRLTVLARIRLGLDRSIIIYPLAQGLVDVEAYYAAGTIPGAVGGIIKSSGEKAEEAETIILETRAKSFFAEERQDRIKTLLSLIDSLKDDQAIELEKNPPERDPDAEKVVRAIDSENLRGREGSAAKQALKKRVLYGQRSSEQLDAWEAAIKAIKK